MEKETGHKYIVYCTTNVVNGKIYVGVHRTPDPYGFDGYLGCGVLVSQPYTYKHSKTVFQRAVNKYGTKSFIRKTLAILDTEEEAYALEGQIVNEEFLGRPDVYNMVPGGRGGILAAKRIVVFQYDLQGRYVKRHESINDAAKANHVGHGVIWHAVMDKHVACGSYWSTDKADAIDVSLYDCHDNHRQPVHLYGVDGTYITSFASQAQCARRIGTWVSNVMQSAVCGYCIDCRYYCSYVKATTYDVAHASYVMNREVHQYDSDGNYMRSYATQREAEMANKGSNVSRSINGKRPDRNGFLWGLTRLPHYRFRKPCSERKRKVGKYAVDGMLVEEYASATQAAKANGTSVWKVLNGTNKTQKGYVYKYIE